MSELIDYTAILRRKYPNTEWTLNGDSYDGLIWLSKSAKPAKADLDNLWQQVKAEIAAEAQTKIDTKNSALAKLAALGLTPEEIRAIS
jgi:hypothetical protein